MQVTTWNVNSIRTRVGQVVDWIADHRPDVVCLQETKCRDDDFPADAFAELGYASAHHGIDHWNGVAIVSRVGLEDIRRGFRDPVVEPFHEARMIAATCGGVRVRSIYVPNGRSLDDPHYRYKLAWLDRLRDELSAERADAVPSMVVGDFNVAPADVDVYDPVRWRGRTHVSIPERRAFAALCEIGLFDLAREALGPDERQFTWWNYRTTLDRDRGLRLDLLLGSRTIRDRLVAVVVDRLARSAPRPSDHAPVSAFVD